MRRTDRRLQCALVIAGSLWITGCATLTPEQAASRELLTRAAQQCRERYPFVRRFDFDRFDRLLWIYQEGTSQSDRDLFAACYRERTAELSKAVAASSSQAAGSRPADSSAPTPTDAWVNAPTWKIGYEWSYRWESPRGGGTFVWRVISEETVEGTDYYVVDSGRYQGYHRKSDLAYFQQKDRGVLEYKYTPPSPNFAWPMHVGRVWEQLYVQERPRDRSTSNLLRVWRVEAKEKISVPAGTFQAFKIVSRNKWNNSVSSETWMAPEVKGIVRNDLHNDYGVEKRELTAFKVD